MRRAGTQFDLAITESFDGGELIKNGNDLSIVFGKESMPYLSMFGGMADKSQWWANNLLFKSKPNLQYNSLTEWTLNNTTLNSAGRQTIETAIKKDLQFLNPDLVQVSIISDNEVSVLIRGFFGEATINFSRRITSDGDFFFMDFNDDFN